MVFEHCAWEAYDEAVNGGGVNYVTVPEKVRILTDQTVRSRADTKRQPLKHAWFHFLIPSHIRQEGWQVEATLSEQRAFQAAMKVVVLMAGDKHQKPVPLSRVVLELYFEERVAGPRYDLAAPGLVEVK